MNIFSCSGFSIQDRIKFFSGQYIQKEILKKDIIPGKIKIPDLFKGDSDKKKENKNKINTKNEHNNDKDENKKNNKEKKGV